MIILKRPVPIFRSIHTKAPKTNSCNQRLTGYIHFALDANPGTEGRERMESRCLLFPTTCVLCCLIRDTCHTVSSTRRSYPVLPQWHVKDPGHSAQSAGGRLHINTHTSLTHQSRSELTIPLSRHSVRSYQ